MEEWKDVIGLEGRYQVSNFGRVRSLRYKFGKRKTPKILRPQHDGVGYVHITIDCKVAKIHRLVALTWIGEPGLYETQVNHKNGIKDDNRVINLEWCTGSQNVLHSYRIGTSIPMEGEKCGASKLTDGQVKEIRRLWGLIDDSGNHIYSQSKISAIYGVNQSNISHIVNRRSWRHI